MKDVRFKQTTFLLLVNLQSNKSFVCHTAHYQISCKKSSTNVILYLRCLATNDWVIADGLTGVSLRRLPALLCMNCEVY